MDELKKRLWECASGECFNCSQYTPSTNASVCTKELMKQAADAIEELQKRVPKRPHWRLIEEADAIETAWMILRGLGYFKEENPQLEQMVREVFATAQAIEVE